MTTQTHKTIGEWINRTFSFESVEIATVKEELSHVLGQHGLRIKKTIDYDDGVEIQAIYGSRIKAFFIGHILWYIGQHLPWGKRLYLRARLKSQSSSTELNIQISPYMELFNSEEIGFITQGVEEKFSDDYYAAFKLHSIAHRLYSQLRLGIPEQLQTFPHKRVATDVLWNMLLYPVDGYKNPRKIHIPPEESHGWSWGAFFIPQIWFLYYDAWGVAALSFATDVLLFYVGAILVGWISPIAGFILGILAVIAVRSFYAINFEKIHYARHGRWRNQKNS